MDRQSLWMAGAIRRRKQEIADEMKKTTERYEAAMVEYAKETADLTLEQEYGPLIQRENMEWPRVHTCLNGWCPEQSEECKRCDAVLELVRQVRASAGLSSLPPTEK